MNYFNNDKSASPINADVVLEYFKKVYSLGKTQMDKKIRIY